MAVLRRAHIAMATRFEALLVGGDAEHLDAVMALLCEEIDRVERLLSRFDPASEVHRANREAAERTIKLSVELACVIADCRAWWENTGGAFDITGAHWRGVEFDAERRTVRLTSDDAQLDFGGYGKGYALDRVAELLAQHGVNDAFLHGGTSSLLARGADEHGHAWRVALPSGETIDLRDTSLSTSGIDERYVTVVAATGAEAEALSTALLHMPAELAQRLRGQHQIYWHQPQSTAAPSVDLRR